MKSALDSNVLVLTRLWSPHEICDAKHALPMLMTGVATALDIQDYSGTYIPTKWEQWIHLEIRKNMAWRPSRPDDDVLHSLHFDFRCPTIIVLGKYDKVRQRVPKNNLRGIAARDGGVCQVSGQKLPPHRWSQDHVKARSKGGSDDWTNKILMDKELNHAKGSKSLEECGMKLLRQPRAPLPLAPISFLFSSHPDHLIFLHK
jgi:5-methylcytosine-specific restriction endonuclease McrA